jgi:hypothetical protein
VRTQDLGAPSHERIAVVHLRRKVAAIHLRAKCRRDPRVSRTRSSQGEGPRVGCSKSRSREIARSEDNRWIQVTGGPLDQEPHRLSRIRGVRRLKGVVFDFTSSEVPRAGHERTRGRTTRWARVTDKEYTSPGGRESMLC